MRVAALLGELIGTFALCFVGAGSIMINAHMGADGPGLVGIALAHGLILSVMVSGLMNVSGAHFNPAVTIGLLVTGRIGAGPAIAYIISQLVGGSLAGVLLFSVVFANVETPTGGSVITDTKNGSPHFDPVKLGQTDTIAKTSTKPSEKATRNQTAVVRAITIEAVATFLLMFAIFGTAVDPRHPNVGGFGIGLTVAANIFVAGPLTGAAMNPARMIGTALITQDAELIGQIWVYCVGPIAGAVIAALLYHFVIMEQPQKK